MNKFVLFVTIIFLFESAYAEYPKPSYTDLFGMGKIEYFVKISALKYSLDDYEKDWIKIEAKRKKFIQVGDTEMAKIAQEEADAVARRIYSINQDIKAMELYKARQDLKN